MVLGKEWKSINPVSLFGFGLLSAVLLQLNQALAASLATSLLLLGLFYLGRSVLRHFYAANEFDHELDHHLPRGLNLMLLAVLTLGIYVVVRPYAVLAISFSTTTLFQLVNTAGWFFYPKVAMDAALLLVFIRHWVPVLFGDILGIEFGRKAVTDIEPEAGVHEVAHEIIEEEKPAVKKIRVTLA